MKALGTTLIVIFLAGLARSYLFWPSLPEQKISAFFSVLQFIAAFALIALTFLYVTATKEMLNATREQIADQNRPPKISIARSWHDPNVPDHINFDLEIANPSVRTTSLRIQALRVGEIQASDVQFEINGRKESRLTIPARDLVHVSLKAQRFSSQSPIKLGFSTKTTMCFEDIFHGELPPVVTQV